MPLIKLEYDDQKVSEEDIKNLSQATRDIVSTATGISDVFVYANSAKIKIQVAPIEIFVEMSDHKIEDEDELMRVIKGQISKWKKETNFPAPINLTLIPMHWKVEINI